MSSRLLESSLVVAWWRLLTADVLPLGSRSIPGRSYQLLRATAYNALSPAVI
jgi:hypothetical protein